MTRDEAMRRLNALMAPLSAWQVAPSLDTELTFHDPVRRRWVRITTGNRLAIAGGGLDHPLTYDLDDEEDLTKYLPLLTD